MTDNIIDLTVSLLSDNWINANTGDVKPNIKNIGEVKRASGDSVLLYEISEVPQDNASGALSKMKTKVIALDVRTFKTFSQAILIKEEIERILNNNQVDPFGDQTYDIQDITDIKPMSDRTRGLYRYQINVKFEQFNIVI